MRLGEVRAQNLSPDGKWAVSILLYGELVEVTADAPVERAVVPLEPLLPRPEQPAGYAPWPHGTAD